VNYFVEYTLEPFKRDGTMVPVSALTDIYQRDDAGYTTYYWFTEEAANEIRTQGRSVGLSRFPVFSRYVILDIDREDDLFTALADTYSISNQLRERNIKHSVWWSGGKGCHVYIHCEPMFGVDVPHSQLCWVRQQGWKVDESLYQHGRLLSNPGRKSKKTGIRKHKIADYDGSILRIERVTPPVKKEKPVGVGTADLKRIALFRAQKALQEDPSSRHQTLWSLAGAFAEAGADKQLTIEVLRWINSSWAKPKDDEGLVRAVTQAFQQISHKQL
jgi:hypothetical protein